MLKLLFTRKTSYAGSKKGRKREGGQRGTVVVRFLRRVADEERQHFLCTTCSKVCFNSLRRRGERTDVFSINWHCRRGAVQSALARSKETNIATSHQRPGKNCMASKPTIPKNISRKKHGNTHARTYGKPCRQIMPHSN